MEKASLIHSIASLADNAYGLTLKPGENVIDARRRIEERKEALDRELVCLHKAEKTYAALKERGISDEEDIASFVAEYAKGFVGKNDEKAYELFELSAEIGGVRAKIEWAKSLLYGTYGITSKEEGMALLRELVRGGNAEAAYLIYLLHDEFPDFVEGEEAKEAYLTAMNLGYPLSLTPLPLDYDVRPYTAILRERFASGEEHLALELAKRKDVSPEERVDFLLLAVKLGQPEAYELYGDLLLEQGEDEAGKENYIHAGEFGRPHCYLKAAKALHASPHFYEGGKQEEELSFYELAAMNNVPEALAKMGMAYLRGKGVDVNPKKGFDYLQKAKRLGESYDAPYYLGQCYRMGLGTKKDVLKGVRYLEMAAKIGHVHAMLELAKIYEKGEGPVRKNEQKAAHFLFCSGARRD
ncbi:MAG: sel1 repeat family protein [Bacilli bacterium]|nr:sel1 repeat family protein [Bacilli bacterium]